MVHQASALHYAVRLRVLMKCGGQLCLVVGTLTLVPLIVAIGSGELPLALRYMLVTVSLLGLGAILGRLRAPEDVQVNESLVLTAGIFLVTPLVMTYPFMASGLTFSDALFETISGSTTTGLSTLGTVAGRSPTFLFTRAWMQWYGGLGIVVLSLALIVEPGLSARRLAVTETDSDDIVGGTRAHARRVLVVYVMLTGGAMLGLWLLGAAPFEAVVYALAAVSTGGFAPHDASLAGLGVWPVAVAELGLPDQARAICYYRDGHFAFIDKETRLHQGDEVVILTHSQNLIALTERWDPQQTNHAKTSAQENR